MHLNPPLAMNVTGLGAEYQTGVIADHYATSPGLPEVFLYLTWVAPTVIQIKPLRG